MMVSGRSSMRDIIAIVLGILPYAIAQNATATVPTCMAGFTWAFNSLRQSPCQIAASLAEVCLLPGTIFSIPSLMPTVSYLGPPQGQKTPCRCSSVYYSVLSACALCQSGSVMTWSVYDQNCTTPFLTVFPSPIPSGVSVPHYAYLDVSAGTGAFDPTLAQAAGGAESTGIPQPSAYPTPSHTPATPSKKNSHAGAIAGEVVGGLVAIGIIFIVIFWLLRRRRNALGSTYDHPVISENNTTLGGVTPYATSPTPKLYDPNDPTTFPNMAHLTSFGGSTHSSPSQFQKPQPTYVAPSFTGATVQRPGPQYHGVAEVMET